jgi:tetratricopeptide (TPR) repeat protein
VKTRVAIALAAGLFVAGIGIGYATQKVAPSLFHGKSKEDAARALLDAARVQAGDGSWERIAIGRVLYLGGHKAEGQAVFDAMLGGKHEDSDEFRIARVYREAGEWSKAKPLFDKFVAGNPKDEKGLAEIGAYYLINGDRDAAEKLFDRSFAISDEVWATVGAAGAYLGVAPEE